jgi:hypothetical protein
LKIQLFTVSAQRLRRQFSGCFSLVSTLASGGRVGGCVSGTVAAVGGVSVGRVLVLDLGPVAVLVGLVLDDLGAAVGKLHAVLSPGGLTVATLLGAELGAAACVGHVVFELVVSRLLKKLK